MDSWVLQEQLDLNAYPMDAAINMVNKQYFFYLTTNPGVLMYK